MSGLGVSVYSGGVHARRIGPGGVRHPRAGALRAVAGGWDRRRRRQARGRHRRVGGLAQAGLVRARRRAARAASSRSSVYLRSRSAAARSRRPGQPGARRASRRAAPDVASHRKGHLVGPLCRSRFPQARLSRFSSLRCKIGACCAVPVSAQRSLNPLARSVDEFNAQRHRLRTRRYSRRYPWLSMIRWEVRTVSVAPPSRAARQSGTRAALFWVFALVAGLGTALLLARYLDKKGGGGQAVAVSGVVVAAADSAARGAAEDRGPQGHRVARGSRSAGRDQRSEGAGRARADLARARAAAAAARHAGGEERRQRPRGA